MTRINLQNAPIPDGITRRDLSFDSNGVSLKGTLYVPSGDGPHPALIVTGAWTTVKDQMAGTYARELAGRGFAAFTFDFTGWGESGGTKRFVEDPATKTADIHAAAAFLASLEEIDASRLSGLGICASSGYMAEAVADNDALSKLALVAPWLHTPAMAEGIYGGPDAAAALIAASDAPDAETTVLTAASTTDETAVMYQAPYYTEADRGLIPSYDNKFSVASWRPWLTYDAMASAARNTKPVLMVGSPSIALPAGAEAYSAQSTAPLEKLWLGADVTQFDFYDRADAVGAAVDAIAEFLS